MDEDEARKEALKGIRDARRAAKRQRIADKAKAWMAREAVEREERETVRKAAFHFETIRIEREEREEAERAAEAAERAAEAAGRAAEAEAVRTKAESTEQMYYKARRAKLEPLWQGLAVICAGTAVGIVTASAIGPVAALITGLAIGLIVWAVLQMNGA